MRIFDSQKKTVWSGLDGDVKGSFRLGSKKSVSAEIGAGTVSTIKIVGRRVSGDGLVTILVRDGKKVIVFSKSFKFTKNSSSEISFASDIGGTDLSISIVRPKTSSGAVFIDRVLMDGVLHGTVSREKNKIEPHSVDYAEMTKLLSRRMNLAIVIPYGIYGGGEVYIRNLISDGHKDFNIDVLFVAKNKLMEELKGCPVKITSLGGLSGLKSRLNSDRYDAVIFYNSKKVHDILEAKKLQENFSADIIEIYHSDFLWSDAISSIRHRRCVDKLFRVSNGLAEDITGIESKDKVCVPVGVDSRKFEEKHVWPNDVKIGFERTIGMVARLSPEKNIDYAMSIMKMIPDYQLVVLGSGPLLRKLEERKESERIKNVTFVGYKRLVEQYYSIFDALLLTSKIEGTPISIVESLMCGVPVFTTSVGEIGRNYSGLHGVNMLSGDVTKDAEFLRSFDYDNFSGDNLKSFARSNHELNYVKDLFFSSILNTSSSFGLPEEGALVLEGEYI